VRVVDTTPLKAYVFRRSTPKRNGRKRDHSGFEVRVRLPDGWAHVAFAYRPISGRRGRGKLWAELSFWRTNNQGRRHKILKRYARLEIGRGGNRNENSVPTSAPPPPPTDYESDWHLKRRPA
jgi:hypothetical protein